MINVKVKIITLQLILLLAGCVIPSVGIEVNSSPIALETAKSINSIATQIFVDTPSPTLSSKEASLKIKELLQTNGNCHLPCWWNITPGQTTWEDAKEILNPLASSMYNDSSDNSELRNIEVFLSEPYLGEFRQEYLVQDGVVKMIEVHSQHDSKYMTPQVILEEYGLPEMVYVGLIFDQRQASAIILYYPTSGIFALYANESQPPQNENPLNLCFQFEYSEIYLWDPHDSFEKTMKFIFESYDNSFLPLETATDLSIEEFSQIFTDPDQPDCIQTPFEIWPNYLPQ